MPGKKQGKRISGMNPCPILDSAGGIWQFRVDKPDPEI
jgi:hypothetical protein